VKIKNFCFTNIGYPRKAKKEREEEKLFSLVLTNHVTSKLHQHWSKNNEHEQHLCLYANRKKEIVREMRASVLLIKQAVTCDTL
jgi:hypothetical protein